MQVRLFNANNAAFLGVTIAFAIIGGLLYAGWFGEWREPDCQTYPVQSTASPQGSFRALHEQEACGSTDALRTVVLIAGGGGRAPVAAFTAVTGKALGVMSIGQRSLPLVLRWTGEHQLVITHPASVTPQLPGGTYGGVMVTLEAVPLKKTLNRSLERGL